MVLEEDKEEGEERRGEKGELLISTILGILESLGS